jgi:hypothetical protein
VEQETKDDWVHTDISTLKTALMSEDLPDSRCDETCISCVHGLSVDNTHPSRNENSESVDNGTVVVMPDRTTSDYILEVVRKQALQVGRELWSGFLPLGLYRACPRNQLWLEMWARGYI